MDKKKTIYKLICGAAIVGLAVLLLTGLEETQIFITDVFSDVLYGQIGILQQETGLFKPACFQQPAEGGTGLLFYYSGKSVDISVMLRSKFSQGRRSVHRVDVSE